MEGFPRGLTAITYEAGDDGVATVTLDRADSHNAFTMAMCEEMAAMWAHVREDDGVRAVVVTGAGEKAFCTGIDRSEVPSEGGAAFTFSPFTYEDPGRQLGPRSNECWKPVVVAINGMACGGAFYLLGEADVLIAAEHATFFDPHVTYGMPAVFEPALMLQRMPFGEVLRMTLLGNHERISATRALEIGLVSEVVSGADLPRAARRVAAAIAAQPPAAVQASLRALWAARELTRAQMLEMGNTFLNLAMSEEALADGQRVFTSGQRIEPHIR
ncbi:MAG: enoyl-CoA hydratase/isomerase family protein [Acidimicrobiales bacterium]